MKLCRCGRPHKALGLCQRCYDLQRDATGARAIQKRKGGGAPSRLRREKQARINAWPGPCAYIDGEATQDVGYNLLQVYYPASPIHTVWVPDRPLSTNECFGTLFAVPRATIFGYGLRYDISNWFTDLPPSSIARLKDGKRVYAGEESGRSEGGKLWRGQYRIDYIPGKCLIIDDRRRPLGERRRYVYDLLPFWQCTFAKALRDNGIPVPAIIDEYKAKRGAFQSADVDAIKAYNEAELRTMELLHGKLCEVLRAGDCRIRKWFGPGAMARLMCKQEGVTQADETLKAALLARRASKERSHAPEGWRAVVDAFYGGRFELSRIGPVERCWEYDLASAYPWAMSQGMPCFACGGEWRRIVQKQGIVSEQSFSVLRVSWRPRAKKPLYWGPFPNRCERHLAWTTSGQGWYHAVEVEAAIRSLSQYYQIDIEDGYVWQPSCSHDPFAWVGDKARERVAIKHVNPGRAQCLKLGLNSCYGILADKAGVDKGRIPRYHNPYWAGLITARTRARLIEASAVGWENIVYLATDGVHSSAPLDLPTGTELGDWEPPSKTGIPAVFLGPGCYIYADGGRGKSRGISLNCFPSDIGYWSDLYSQTALRGGFDVPLQRFVSVYEAHARSLKRSPEDYHALANTWQAVQKHLSYALSPRRRCVGNRWLASPGSVWQSLGPFIDSENIIEEEEWASWQPEESGEYVKEHE